MECEDVRQRIKAFIDDDLEDSERMAVCDHLDSCRDCSRVVKQIEKLIGVLRTWRAENPPADLYERLKAGLESREPWWKKVWTPALAWKAVLRFAEVAAAVLITLAVSHKFQKPQVAPSGEELATINFYVAEHQEAVLQAASLESAERQSARVTLNRDDIMYYEYIDDYRQVSRPGVILKGPDPISDPETASPGPNLASAKALTLPQARMAVTFDPVAPQRIHPGYILDTITKVAGRESLHLLYTNGIDTFSVFEQPLGGDRGLAAEDFRKYAVYRSSMPVESLGNQGGTTILAWKNTHVSFVLIGRTDMSRMMEIAQALTDASHRMARTSG